MRNEEQQGPHPPEAPHREFRFKRTEFEVTNRPADETAANAPINVQKLIDQANGASAPVAGIIVPSQADNEVHAMLRANVAQEKARGLNGVIPAPGKLSRRKRDFWLLFIGGNLLVMGIVAMVQKNPVTLLFGFSAMILLSLGLIWVMWFVMDDY